MQSLSVDIFILIIIFVLALIKLNRPSETGTWISDGRFNYIQVEMKISELRKKMQNYLEIIFSISSLMAFSTSLTVAFSCIFFDWYKNGHHIYYRYGFHLCASLLLSFYSHLYIWREIQQPHHRIGRMIVGFSHFCIFPIFFVRSRLFSYPFYTAAIPISLELHQ